MVPRKPDAAKSPAKAVTIHLRVEPLLLDALDRFIAGSGPQLTRPEAVLDLLTDELVRLRILQPTKEMTEH